MTHKTMTTLLAGAASVALLATPALARGLHRHHLYHAQYAGADQPYGYGYAQAPQAYGGYYGTNGWEADVNARLTAQAYREPGVTLELAPDSKQTATGGPSGGVPGFSGH